MRRDPNLLPLFALIVLMILSCCSDAGADETGPTLNSLGVLFFKDIAFSASYALTDQLTITDSSGVARPPLKIDSTTVSTFSLRIDKPVVSQLFRHTHVMQPGTLVWDLFVEPWRLTANATYGDTLRTTKNGPKFTDDVVSTTTYAVGFAYRLDLGDVMKHCGPFKR